ncbi:hypothetical protein HYU10_00665 [Candidatus Woesearchaeota archaeon]|nr:hypothetical protein [Candidatus Woesearchaeota archaeon]MBI2661608.1 hypothetical protein [Candidatus Woesearchaeota archaeon]
MKENTLIKISIIFSLAGLVILYFISGSIKIDDYKPKSISSEIGQDVKVNGVVKGVRKFDNAAIIEVEQKSVLDVAVLGKSNLSITAGDSVEIIGEVQEYNGKEEVIANRIRVIR